MKVICYFLSPLILLFSAPAEEFQPLDVVGGISWREVFQAGYRPPHVREGFDACQQNGVSLALKRGDYESILSLGNGDVRFTIAPDDTIRLMSFYGRDPISAEEGRVLAEKFVEMFRDSLRHVGGLHDTPITPQGSYGAEGIVPQRRVYVDLRKSKFEAETDGYRILLSFSHSSDNLRPINSDLTISHRVPNYRDLKDRFTRREIPIRPPEGFENINLSARERSDHDSFGLFSIGDTKGMEIRGLEASRKKVDSGLSKQPETNYKNGDKSNARKWYLVGASVLVVAVGFAIFVRGLLHKKNP